MPSRLPYPTYLTWPCRVDWNIFDPGCLATWTDNLTKQRATSPGTSLALRKDVPAIEQYCQPVAVYLGDLLRYTGRPKRSTTPTATQQTC